MKHVSILIPHGHTSVVNIEGSHQIMNEVNTLRKREGKPPLFKVQLVGISKEASQRGLFTIMPDVLIDDVKKTDLIMIPAIHGKPDVMMKNNEAFVPWIKHQYEHGAEIATFCIASFFLQVPVYLMANNALHIGRQQMILKDFILM